MCGHSAQWFEMLSGKRVFEGRDVSETLAGVIKSEALFEMLSGKRVFEGRDVSETLAGVIKSEAPWQALPSDTPPTLDKVLRRCLEKEPKHRLRDMGDVQLALSGAFETTDSAQSAPTAPPLQVWQRPIPAALMGLLLLVVGGLAVWTLVGSEVANLRVERFTVSPLPPAAVDLVTVHRDVAISPAGDQLVFLETVAGSPIARLHVRSADALAGAPLEGLVRPQAPFISPAGAWVGFYEPLVGVLRKVSILGGPAATLASVASLGLRGADWAEDDTIIFGTLASGLWSVSAAGGEPEALTTPPGERGVSHAWPPVLPGGRAVLFTVRALARTFVRAGDSAV